MNGEESPYCYSAGCSWHGPISETGLSEPSPKRTFRVGAVDIEVGGHRLPCCPFCGSMLFQVGNEQVWLDGARKYGTDGHENYFEMLAWTRTQKRCWPSLKDAGRAFMEATGKVVKL